MKPGIFTLRYRVEKSKGCLVPSCSHTSFNARTLLPASRYFDSCSTALRHYSIHTCFVGMQTAIPGTCMFFHGCQRAICASTILAHAFLAMQGHYSWYALNYTFQRVQISQGPIYSFVFERSKHAILPVITSTEVSKET